jgi:Domain of unknown function (DUF4189)
VQRGLEIVAGLGAVMLLLATAPPASAGFGAVAYDQNTGKYGASWNQATQSAAFEQALRQCASKDCRVHRVEPKGCGALALSDKDKAWGGADRATLAAAKRDAVSHCRRHTTIGTCTVRLSGCNE